MKLFFTRLAAIVVGILAGIGLLLGTLEISYENASAATGIDLEVFNSGSPADLTFAYQLVVDTMLTNAGEQPVTWNGVDNLDQLREAQDMYPNVMNVNREFVAELKAKSLFAPAFELGIAARVYQGLQNGNTPFDTVQGQAQLACYGGAAVKMFSQMTGLSMQPADQAVLDEKFQASLDFHVIGAAFVRGQVDGLVDGNCDGSFRP